MESGWKCHLPLRKTRSQRGVCNTRSLFFLRILFLFFWTLFLYRVTVCVCVWCPLPQAGERSFCCRVRVFYFGMCPLSLWNIPVGTSQWLTCFIEHPSLWQSWNPEKASQQVVVFLGWHFPNSLRCPELLPREEDMKGRWMGGETKPVTIVTYVEQLSQAGTRTSLWS